MRETFVRAFRWLVAWGEVIGEAIGEARARRDASAAPTPPSVPVLPVRLTFDGWVAQRAAVARGELIPTFVGVTQERRLYVIRNAHPTDLTDAHVDGAGCWCQPVIAQNAAWHREYEA